MKNLPSIWNRCSAGGCLAITWLLAIGPLSARSAIVSFRQVALNDANGAALAAVSSAQFLETAISYSTVTAPGPYSNNAYRFTHWTNSSYPLSPFRDPWGRSLNPTSFILLEDTVATAHYLPSTRDTDADGLPDWYEIEYFGSLTNAPANDVDADLIPLSLEYSGKTHPLYGNSSLEGGLSYVDSSLITCNLAGYASYTLRSVPAGTVNQFAFVRPGTSITSPTMAANTSFGQWTLDGVRQQDAWGVAYPQITFVVETANREGVAFLYAGDTDTDGLPDAYEQYYLGTLEHDGNWDGDGDGIPLSAERTAGTLPHLGNFSAEGGVVYADSSLVTVNLAGYSTYRLSSVPAGTVNQTASVRDGTVITTPNMAATTFGYWLIDGLRQQDAWGAALRQVSFVVDGADREGVAHLFSSDSDGDGVNDGIEQFYFGDLSRDGQSDTDGDGRTLLQEIAAGSLPHFGDLNSEGGVYWADSASVVVNLQPFERLRFALVDSLLREIYSFDPHMVTGWDVGERSSIALGDWDGDGDLDVFIAHENGLQVFENIGTVRTFNLAPRTPQFAALAGFVEAIPSAVLCLGDWDLDGREDLVVGGETGTAYLIRSSGHFGAVQSVGADLQIETGSTRALPALGDLNADGRVDLMLVREDGQVALYEHSGTPVSPYPTGTANALGVSVASASSIGIADINGKGLLDVAVADAEGRLWEFHNQGAGSFVLKSKVWAGSGQGFASRLAITPRDYDGDGDTDILAGMENGGLIGLRDPRVRRPVGLASTPGASAILLSWDPDPQSRIKGYNLYRSDTESGAYQQLNAITLTQARFEDAAALPQTEYWYYVTGLTDAYFPGSSLPVEVESAPSNKLHVLPSAGLGTVVLRANPVHARPGRVAGVVLSLDGSDGIRGRGLELRIAYDSASLTPLAQLDATKATVVKSRLSESLTLADNCTTATGVMIITGSSGETLPGKGTFITLQFMVGDTVPRNSNLGVTITSALLRDLQGNLLNVTIVNNGSVIVDGAYAPGDLTGDAEVTQTDEDLLKLLIMPQSRPPTDDERAAGDTNADGVLDLKDWTLLRKLLSGNIPGGGG